MWIATESSQQLEISPCDVCGGFIGMGLQQWNRRGDDIKALAVQHGHQPELAS